MNVIKIGGGCLNGDDNIRQIVSLLKKRAGGHVVVVSALGGVTDTLLTGMDRALENEDNIPELMRTLKKKHLDVAENLMGPDRAAAFAKNSLSVLMNKLERYYYGLNFTRELTPRIQDVIASYGERMCAHLLAEALGKEEGSALCKMPHKVGMITDGKYGDATALLPKCAKNIQKEIFPLLDPDRVIIMPGFFGVSTSGDITTFGRGGSDYSAAVMASCLKADFLEIWKDTQGYMSADPRHVPEAERIDLLSYEEAAELSYFGAKILHPRTVEPLRKEKVPIAIKNRLNPDLPGTLITSKSPRRKQVIKSVAYDTDITLLKVHASGVGARPGILAQVAGGISKSGINIRSVVTSQTCISLLLSQKDLDAGYQALMDLKPRPFRRLEKVENVALICIVGQGLAQKEGIAANCFTAVHGCSVNVEMISFGPSPVALYFIVKTDDLHKAVNAIHSSFFSSPRCQADPALLEEGEFTG